MSTVYDVVIIGAGPAGTSAGLRLLQLGYHIAIVEQLPFPRPQIGESLSPGIWNIFEYLDAEPLLQHSSYLSKISARVIWNTQIEKRMNPKDRGPGIVVDRGQLDNDLLQLCKKRGAQVFQPAKLEKIGKKGDLHHIKLKTNSGTRELQTRYVFDARGKKGIPKSIRVQTAPLSVAIWTDVSADFFPKATLIEALEDGWMWGSPLPNNKFRLMAFTDPSFVKKKSMADCMKEIIHASSLFHFPFTSGNPPVFNSCPVQSYYNASAWKDNYLHLGESAFALDPLSSTGVEKAMRFSLQAVIAFHSLQKNKNKSIAKKFYEDKLLKTVKTHSDWTRQFYGESWVPAARLFWKSRRDVYRDPQWKGSSEEILFDSGIALTSSINEMEYLKEISISDTLSRWNDIPLRISKATTFKDAICPVGDLLEVKKALHHPKLAGPIAYISEREIAPLLGSIGDVFTLRSMINQWGQHLQLETATHIAISLWQMGIFETEILTPQEN